MKKICILASFIFLVSISNGQISKFTLGFDAGISQSSLTYYGYPGGDAGDNMQIVSIATGLNVQYNFNKRLSLKTALYYTPEIYFGSSSYYPTVYSKSVTRELSYFPSGITIPLLLKYTIPLKKINIFMEGGISHNSNNGRFKTKYFDSSMTLPLITEQTINKNINAFCAGIGIAYKCNDHISINFEIIGTYDFYNYNAIGSTIGIAYNFISKKKDKMNK